MRLIALAVSLFLTLPLHAQQPVNPAAKLWADSVYNTLGNEERIAQLIVTRLSSMDVKTKKITFLYDQVTDLVKKYNIGGVCVFQGSPVLQAGYLNSLQAMAKTPILISMDAEWGVGMRIIDSVMPLPKQMMLGAIKDSSIIYKYGQVVADQCRRMGIQMNYAPVMDVNNNPDNPVINDRSFGEDKYKVARFGIQYMKGMQDMGVMACAKHFPGHGDVAVDSHYDLPVINKTEAQLDSLELYPFRQLFKEGVGSVMIAHLYIPSIDNRLNRPSSLSANIINGLLRDSIGYEGLTITDGLEMQGVKKYFPDGESSVESIIAGNDLLCLPDNVPLVIKKIKEAIAKNKISWKAIEMHCKKVLMAKYRYGLALLQPINTENLTADLNKDIPAMRKLVAENAITLIANQDKAFFPLDETENNHGEMAYVGIGINIDNAFSQRMRSDYKAGIYYFEPGKKNTDSINALLDSIVLCHQKVVIGIHNINRAPANNFGLSNEAVAFINTLQQKARSITFLFGNAYAAKNWCFAKNMVVCYEDDSIVQNTAIDMLQGKLPYKGTLPVTVCENLPFGYGLVSSGHNLQLTDPRQAGMDAAKLAGIDSIVTDAISKKAMPGCVVLVAKNGKIALEKAYGNYSYEKNEPVSIASVYDLASLTKILSTTLAVMKLYEEGRIDLKKKLGEYLPAVKRSNKENITVEKLLLHEAGLSPFTAFSRETLDKNGFPDKKYYSAVSNADFVIRVADKLFLKNEMSDSFYKRIIQSPLGTADQYVYSDNDFIFLGKLVESQTGMLLDEYVKKYFYEPMGLESIGYRPLNHIALNRIVPSENDDRFRFQVLRGDVHDPGAALLGGVAGHAGLFGDAYDIACIMQMLLNGGELNGKRYLEKETVALFTAYHSDKSRRGYGFDKPEKDNATRPEPYPALSASPATFGHYGFTGTCAWADPENKLIFVFLSNRLYPQGSNLLLKMNIRPKIFETIYQSLIK